MTTYEEYFIDAYEEHLAHINGEASELQNCLTEAEGAVSELSSEVEVEGDGPVTVRWQYAYFCKSTDAFAGMVDYKVARFPDHDAADAAIEAYIAEELRASGMEMEDAHFLFDDRDIVVTPPRPPVELPAVEFDDDNIPF